VWGDHASIGLGVFGTVPEGFGVAGFAYGTETENIGVYGGAMLIDHPIEPESKYLYHASVQSPDMMNVYNGNAVLDGNGDYRYQLTPVGAPGPNLYVAEEVDDNRFRIAGGTSEMKVSWTVTGIRKDPQAARVDRTVGRDKPASKIGRYFSPAAFGKSKNMSTLHAAHPQLLDQMKRGIRKTKKSIHEE
jgi:hypothetical protein